VNISATIPADDHPAMTTGVAHPGGNERPPRWWPLVRVIAYADLRGSVDEVRALA
jgi:hypothetical protein